MPGLMGERVKTKHEKTPNLIDDIESTVPTFVDCKRRGKRPHMTLVLGIPSSRTKRINDTCLPFCFFGTVREIQGLGPTSAMLIG